MLTGFFLPSKADKSFYYPSRYQCCLFRCARHFIKICFHLNYQNKKYLIVTYLQERSQIRAYLYDLSFLTVIHCHLLCPRLQNLHHSALHKRPHVSGTVSSSPDYLLGNSGSIFKANGRNGHVSDFRTGTSNACWAIFPF